MYFIFDFGWYSTHFDNDIVRYEQGKGGGEWGADGA